MTDPVGDDVRCRDFVAVASDYIEEALEEGLRKAIENHLEECEDCGRYLDQMTLAVRALRAAAAAETVSDEERSRILGMLDLSDAE